MSSHLESPLKALGEAVNRVISADPFGCPRTLREQMDGQDARTSGTLHVSYALLFITPDDDNKLASTYKPIGGLVGVDDRKVVVHAGIHTGPVDLTVALSAVRPSADLAHWEDVVELSYSPAGDARVATIDEIPATFPIVVPGGAGRHRIRVSARGRDSAPDLAVFEPVEAYLIEVWPEREEAAEILRATSERSRDVDSSYL
jgi:hypothetical protein